MMKCFGAKLITGTATALFTMGLLQAIPAFAQQQSPIYGQIHFLDGEGVEKCAIAVPETIGRYSFADSNQYCQNDMVKSFWLENIPSATKIGLYERETCTESQFADNFYFKFKTVKQPTDWTQTPNPPQTMTIEDLRNLTAGYLIPGKYLRVEGAWVGSDFSGEDSLNEDISCVVIERSPPVN